MGTERDIISGAVESVSGRGTVSKTSKYLDQFAQDNFYLMTLQKTDIVLNLSVINRMEDEWMKGLFAHRMEYEHKVKGPEDTTNVIKAQLFPLFTNLRTVSIIRAGVYPFSVGRLVDELSSVELPDSLSTITISGGTTKWAQQSVDSAVRDKAAALNMTVTMKEDG